MTQPTRIQRRRTRGWKMPPNTVSVTRPSLFGNPFTVARAIEAGFIRRSSDPGANEFLVASFRHWLFEAPNGRRWWWEGSESDQQKADIRHRLPELCGKNLACWCPLDQPCHADVLLELANGPMCEVVP